jgi:hypothetical protein
MKPDQKSRDKKLMTLQTITIQMPDNVYQRARRAAQALQRPTEDVLFDTLSATLPPLDDVPPDMAGELAAMALLSNEVLENMARATMPPERQRQLDDLLERQGRDELDEPGQHQLAELMAKYGRTMLRRAHAVALLAGRGRPVPPLEPISPLS